MKLYDISKMRMTPQPENTLKMLNWVPIKKK